MKSLKKALDILDIFLNSEDNQISSSDLAKLSGLDNAAVSRILSTFVEKGYIYQPEKRGKYSLGNKLFKTNFVNKRRMYLLDIARPDLMELSEKVKESIQIAFRSGDKIDAEEIAASSHPWTITVTSPSHPLYCTGMGKIFLAYMAQGELKEYLRTVKLHAFTENTLTDVNQLYTHLMRIAKEGIAYNDEEHFRGIRSIAAPIWDSSGSVVASFSIVGPTVRLSRANTIEITPDMKSCSIKISNKLGYDCKK